jgi:hypothetical protein
MDIKPYLRKGGHVSSGPGIHIVATDGMAYGFNFAVTGILLCEYSCLIFGLSAIVKKILCFIQIFPVACDNIEFT